ncbi:MAG TPA: hypothetical protein VFH71_02615 [Rhodanobacteraceae bacterium]|nr:hypothetical protein [Rhodanobacteraceae bacterium]
MQVYRNLSGNSGVRAYEIREGAIEVEFVNGQAYLYDDAHTGAVRIRNMQALARAGRGLSTYISREVREAYAKRLH